MEPTKVNFHTHTHFCDGKSTAEEQVLSAIDKNFDVLGFSSHSMFPFARSWHIAPRDFPEYEKTINELKVKYADKIQIRLGYEADYFPGVTIPSKALYKKMGLNPDYLLGSVHYIVKGDNNFTVDHKPEKLRDYLIQLYGNGKDWSSVNGKAVVCDYFAAEREMLSKGDFEILGHCDLIRVRNEVLNFFDEKESWYIKELKATTKAIAKAGVIAEINTGAIARGTMSDFYPSETFLTMLYEAGVPVMINSDCHSADKLDCMFEEAKQRAKKIGYKELTFPEADSFKHITL